MHDVLFYKTNRGKASEDYVFEYFTEALFDNNSFSSWQITLINQKLKQGNKHFYSALSDSMILFPLEQFRNLFGEAFDECSKIIEADESAKLPF